MNFIFNRKRKDHTREILSSIYRRQGDIIKEVNEYVKIIKQYIRIVDNLDKMNRTLLIKIKAMADYHGLTFDSDNGKYIKKNKN